MKAVVEDISTVKKKINVEIAPDDVATPPDGPASANELWAQTQTRAQRPRSIQNWPALVPLLEAMPEVAAVSPMAAGAGLLAGGVRGETAGARSPRDGRSSSPLRPCAPRA